MDALTLLSDEQRALWRKYYQNVATLSHAYESIGAAASDAFADWITRATAISVRHMLLTHRIALSTVISHRVQDPMRDDVVQTERVYTTLLGQFGDIALLRYGLVHGTFATGYTVHLREVLGKYQRLDSTKLRGAMAALLFDAECMFGTEFAHLDETSCPQISTIRFSIRIVFSTTAGTYSGVYAVDACNIQPLFTENFGIVAYKKFVWILSNVCPYVVGDVPHVKRMSPASARVCASDETDDRVLPTSVYVSRIGVEFIA